MQHRRSPSLFGIRAGWELFPLAVFAAFVVVIGVNATMVKLALDTFPGQTAGEGFDVSNRYDHILDLAQKEAALGWKADISVAEGQPVVILSAAPEQAAIEGSAERPVGPREHTPLVFEGAGPRRVAETVLAPGQWDILLTVSDGTNALHTAKRVIVK